MAGQPGRSGGWNRKPIAAHLLAGTFRADRHAARLPRVAAGTGPTVPEDLLAGLGAEGRAFLEALYREYELTGAEGYIARLAAQSYDDAATARTTGDLKAARAACRQFFAALQRLGVPAAERR